MTNPQANADTRTLHPLVLPERLFDPGREELRTALFVDVDTTGIAHEHDEVIEFAALPFTYTLDGRIGGSREVASAARERTVSGTSAS